MSRIDGTFPRCTASSWRVRGPQWETAKDLSAEMMKRFARVLVDTPTQRARKAELAVRPRFRDTHVRV